MARTLAPTIRKTLGLSALAGLASEGASQIVKSISGGGMHYFVPRENLHYLAKNQHLLNKRQINDVAKAHQTGKSIHISAPKTQSGGFLGTLLASIGVPLVLDMVKKMTGNGGPQIGAPPPPKRGRGGQQIGAPTPHKRGRVVLKLVLLHLFFGNWTGYSVGRGKKKTLGEGILFGKNSPFNGVPLLGAML